MRSRERNNENIDNKDIEYEWNNICLKDIVIRLLLDIEWIKEAFYLLDSFSNCS